MAFRQDTDSDMGAEREEGRSQKSLVTSPTAYDTGNDSVLGRLKEGRGQPYAAASVNTAAEYRWHVLSIAGGLRL